MYYKTCLKEKQQLLYSTHHSLGVFGDHCLHYQVNIKTNIKLLARID